MVIVVGIDIGGILKAKRKEHKWSVTEVTEKLRREGVEVRDKTLYSWESGYREPDVRTFLTLCRIYGISLLSELDNAGDSDKFSKEEVTLVEQFRYLDDHGRALIHAAMDCELQRMEDSERGQVVYMTLRHSLQPASAGTGFFLDYEQMERWGVKYNNLTRRADLCVTVSGDSMEPRFHDGDVVLVQTTPSVDIGEIGLFVVDGCGYIKKRGSDRLISLNHAYADIMPSPEDRVDCVGRVLGVLEPQWIIDKSDDTVC